MDGLERPSYATGEALIQGVTHDSRMALHLGWDCAVRRAVALRMGPLLIFATLRFRLPPRNCRGSTCVFIPCRPKHGTTSPRPIKDLTALGFELVGTLLLPDLTPNAQTLFALYANRATADMAMSAIICCAGRNRC